MKHVRSVFVVAFALALAAGCDKEKTDPAKGNTPGTAAPGSAGSAATPGTGPAPGTIASGVAAATGGDKTKLSPNEGAQSGDELAKLAETTPAPADLKEQPKVDPATVSKAGIAKPIKGFASVEETGFRVAYQFTNEITNEGHKQIQAVFKRERTLEQVAEVLNNVIQLPRTVDIQLVDCGAVNAFYDPNNNRLIICHEIIMYFIDIFKPVVKTEQELGMAVIGATFFTFFHELGHGLIHQLELPAVGREEDAVDQLATLVLLEGGDEGTQMALSGARWFALQSEKGGETPFYDEHAFDQQRFYNILCLVYGSDQQKYAGFVEQGMLPEPRAVRCPDEFAQIKKAWEKLLEPHQKKPAETQNEVPVAVPGEDTPPVADPAAPPPAAPPAAGEQVSCELVSQYVIQLIVKQMEAAGEEARIEALPADQQEAEIQSIRERLQQVYEFAQSECTNKSWPEAGKMCVMQSQTFEDAQKCDLPE